MIKRVLVFGAGAVGIYYGCKLLEAGLAVTFCCRSDYVTAIKEGFVIMESDQSQRFTPPVIDDVMMYADEKPDMILICTKALPTIDLPVLLEPVIGAQTSLVLVQNGLGIEDALSKAYPNNRLITTVSFSCLQRVKPATVQSFGFNRLTFGLYPDAKPDDVTLRLMYVFELVGVPCRVMDNMQKQRWKKLLWNVPFNALSVLGGCLTMDRLLAQPAVLDSVRAVMNEVCVLATCAGFDLSERVCEEQIQSSLRMGTYKTSMLVDVEAGRPLEVDAIYGSLVHRALGYDIPVPWLAFFNMALRRYVS